jgi:hypothetical protein
MSLSVLRVVLVVVAFVLPRWSRLTRCRTRLAAPNRCGLFALGTVHVQSRQQLLPMADDVQLAHQRLTCELLESIAFPVQVECNRSSVTDEQPEHHQGRARAYRYDLHDLIDPILVLHLAGTDKKEGADIETFVGIENVESVGFGPRSFDSNGLIVLFEIDHTLGLQILNRQ